MPVFHSSDTGFQLSQGYSELRAVAGVEQKTLQVSAQADLSVSQSVTNTVAGEDWILNGILDVNLVLDTPVNRSPGNTILHIVSQLVGSNSECQTICKTNSVCYTCLFSWPGFSFLISDACEQR